MVEERDQGRRGSAVRNKGGAQTWGGQDVKAGVQCATKSQGCSMALFIC